MAQPKPISIRSYRIYFRDIGNALTRSHEVELGSDEDARELAALMLEEARLDCAQGRIERGKMAGASGELDLPRCRHPDQVRALGALARVGGERESTLFTMVNYERSARSAKRPSEQRRKLAPADTLCKIPALP